MQTFNLFDGETDTPPDGTEPPGYLAHAVRLGPKLGASRLGMSIYDLPPGEAICPYHFEWTDGGVADRRRRLSRFTDIRGRSRAAPG
jgi:hypothetical protein